MSAKTTRITSREFNQDIGRAKRAAENGPVIVTDRGRPAYVLLRHTDYAKLVTGKGKTMVDLLDHPESAGIEFEPVPLSSIVRPVEF